MRMGTRNGVDMHMDMDAHILRWGGGVASWAHAAVRARPHLVALAKALPIA